MVSKGSTLALIALIYCLHINFSNAQSSLQLDKKQNPFQNKYSKGPFEPLENSETEAINNDVSMPWRLKRKIVPTKYQLKLTPILDSGYEAVGEQWTVPGEVTITARVMVKTNTITLHSKYLEYDQSNVKVMLSNNPILVTNMSVQEEYNFVEITIERELLPLEMITIQITYTARIQEELHGLYRSSYTTPEGETKTIAVTQMEALNARELFPCFDEPSYKAVFEVTVGRHANYIALTNTKSVSNTSMEPHPEWVWESFEPTKVKMSTYLFALVISEFEYYEATGAANVLKSAATRTYAPKHYIDRRGGEYAADQTEIILKHFGDYFGQAYPLNKMDMVAAPSFYFGAMENLGLNIYRESLLLYFPDESTEAERYQMTSVFSHELAHQWFGNLVSPAWWTHIWLNEGMAAFVQYIGLNKAAPEFTPMDFFINDELQTALYYDAMEDYRHPLKINEAEWIKRDAMSWFDSLTYQKGASLAGMLQGVLSEPVMKEGLQNYQKRMKGKAAVQDDLFRCLNEVAKKENKIPPGMTIKRIMDSWTLKAGFPLVTVSRSENGTFQVNQKKFNGKPFTNETRILFWRIPLSIATSDDQNFDPAPDYWLTEQRLTLSETNSSSSWIIVNAGATGYYRVLYNSDLHQPILDQLESNHTIIDKFSRSQILDDYFAFAAYEMVTVDTAMSFTKYLRSAPEVEMIVWNPVFTNMAKVLNMIGSAGNGMFEDFKNYFLPAIKLAIKATGGYAILNEDSKGIDVLRHAQFLDWACALEDTECQDFALGLVNTWKENAANNPIQRDLKPVVYCAAIAKGDNTTFEFILQQYKETTITSKQQNLLLNALGCVTDPELINGLIEGTTTEGYLIEKNHGLAVLKKLATNMKARPALLSFLNNTANVEKIINFYQASSDPIVEIVNTLSAFISSNKDQAVIETLALNENLIEEGSLNGALSVIKQNVIWTYNTGVQIQNFFKSVLDPTPTTTEPSTPPTTTGPTGGSQSTEENSQSPSSTDGSTTPPTENTTSKGYMAKMDWKFIPALQTIITILILSRP